MSWLVASSRSRASRLVRVRETEAGSIDRSPAGTGPGIIAERRELVTEIAGRHGSRKKSADPDSGWRGIAGKTDEGRTRTWDQHSPRQTTRRQHRAAVRTGSGSVRHRSP